MSKGLRPADRSERFTQLTNAASERTHVVGGEWGFASQTITSREN